MQLSPYIIFNGRCEEALNFYAKALNGEIKSLMYFNQAPEVMPSADKNAVMHADFEAPGLVFMASDSGQQEQGETATGMIHLSLNFDSAEEEQKIFDALSDGARITMPLQDTFWGAKFGMLTDKFGVNWMFNYDKKES